MRKIAFVAMILVYSGMATAEPSTKQTPRKPASKETVVGDSAKSLFYALYAMYSADHRLVTVTNDDKDPTKVIRVSTIWVTCHDLKNGQFSCDVVRGS